MNKFQKSIQAALLADAHTMCLHWNYDENHIAELLSQKKIDITMLNAGDESSYFQGKNVGEQTHLGDQILHLYHYLNTQNHFSLDEYTMLWQQYIETYKWHIDRSSKTTIEHISFNVQPSGADSTDFCGAAMGIPLLSLEYAQKKDMLDTVISRVMMTHNNTLTKDTALWVVCSLLYIDEGHSIMRAIDMAAQDIQNQIFQDIFHQGIDLCKSEEPISTLIKQVGRGCGIGVGLPILIVLLSRNQTNLMDFMIENTTAGADASSRALIGGALIGASPHSTIPQTLLSQLQSPII